MVTSNALYGALDELITRAETAASEFSENDDYEQLVKDLGEVWTFASNLQDQVSSLRETLNTIANTSR